MGLVEQFNPAGAGVRLIGADDGSDRLYGKNPNRAKEGSVLSTIRSVRRIC